MLSVHHRRLLFWISIVLIVVILSIPSMPSSTLQANGMATFAQVTYLPISDKNYPYDWLQFGGDPTHSSNNTIEDTLTVGNVANLNLLFQVTLPGIADGAPVYLSNVSTLSGYRDLVFLTTRNGYIAALDAHTGALIWSKQYGPAGCLINNQTQPCYTTSSPAIDPNRQYVYSYGLDGYVHKYLVGDGTEIITGGWPELTTLKRYDEKGSSALSIAIAINGTRYLFVAQAGYPGDLGNYQGHITAIDLSDGSQNVFNTLCSDQAVHFVDSRTTDGLDCFPNTMGAIWARPGVVYDPYLDRILMTTGNGTFQPGNFMWGDSVISLNPDGSGTAGKPLDSYTPVNYQDLQNSDLDLGSTAPAILPLSPGKYPHLAVQGGKDGLLRLINLDNLSGQGGVGHVGGEVFSMHLPVGGMVLTQPAVWINPSDHSTWIFVSTGNGLSGLQLKISATGDPSLVQKWSGGGGTSPLVANGVLFIAHSGLISAYKAVDGTLLWSNSQIGSIHWESPIVVKGVVYISDQSGNLTAYSLP
jgi:hypothetical protein